MMKRYSIFLFVLFVCSGAVFADLAGDWTLSPNTRHESLLQLHESGSLRILKDGPRRKVLQAFGTWSSNGKYIQMEIRYSKELPQFRGVYEGTLSDDGQIKGSGIGRFHLPFHWTAELRISSKDKKENDQRRKAEEEAIVEASNKAKKEARMEVLRNSYSKLTPAQ